MKRTLAALTVLSAAAVLGGCPVYSSSSDYRVCNANGCFDCPDPAYSGMCIAWACSTDADCGSGYACSGGECVTAGNGGPPPTDCASTPGCQSGYVCKLSGGIAACVPLPAEEDASTVENDAGTGHAGSDASLAVEASSDAASAVQQAPDVAEAGEPVIPCNADGDCSLGSKCVDGQCTAREQLCSDATQCVAPGEQCANGICVPSCSASVPCPTGYACNLTIGVCDVNPDPCAGSGASSCQGGAVCVESHCVPPCASAEGAPACSSGQACVNGGCIPDQRAHLDCKNDGQSGLLANQCDTSSICLHHDCYLACDADGGGCGSAVCKQVTVTAGTYAVCAAPSTLGSDCDPAAGAACSDGGACVNGYCR